MLLRILSGLLALLMLCAPAIAEDVPGAMGALFEALKEGAPGAQATFAQQGSWMSAVAQREGVRFTEYVAFAYDMEGNRMATWDDLFVDADAAAEHIAALAEASYEANSYSEYSDVTPVPRGNFALREGQLFLYYPPEQLSYFSGHAGAFAFYAYELSGLVKEGAPLLPGDLSEAGKGLLETLEAGSLPGALSAITLGMPMAEADERLRAIDVPDVRGDRAVWRYEAPEMRGVLLLSSLDEDRIVQDTLTGIHAERIDFYGLQTGIATLDDCLQALGKPDGIWMLDEENPYALMAAEETLLWGNEGVELLLGFQEGVLKSVTLQRRENLPSAS